MNPPPLSTLPLVAASGSAWRAIVPSSLSRELALCEHLAQWNETFYLTAAYGGKKSNISTLQQPAITILYTAWLTFKNYPLLKF